MKINDIISGEIIRECISNLRQRVFKIGVQKALGIKETIDNMNIIKIKIKRNCPLNDITKVSHREKIPIKHFYKFV